MPVKCEMISEIEIISMLQENNPLVWSYMYDKYSSAMYRLINNLTEDKVIAEEILINAFLDLRKNQTLANVQYALLPIILRHIHFYTTIYLEKISITPITLQPPKDSELIHLLTNQCNSINDAAVILHITIEEAGRKLHHEFLNLRMTGSINETSFSDDDTSFERLLQPITQKNHIEAQNKLRLPKTWLGDLFNSRIVSKRT